ncbi:MAG: hypothetical protein ACM3U2_12815 [Deltaproteobacteria bacterium]
MAHFYRHSGIVPLGGLVQTVFAGLGSAISIGFVYSYAMVYIPIIYLNFLGTAGFGFIVGYLVKQSARAGKIRNRFVPAAVGFVSALAGLYFAWGADLLARQGVPGNLGFLAAFNPEVLWDYMQWFYENGQWAIGQHARDNIKGIPLAVVWIAEFGTIVGLATGIPWGEIRKWVFCENCGWWETIESNVNHFSAVDADTTAERLKQVDLTVLREMTPARPSDMMHLRLHLATCETCDESNYLDLDQVTVTVDKKGNAKTTSKLLVEKLQIAAADVPLVKAAGPVPESPAPSAEMMTEGHEPATTDENPGERPT